MVELKGLLLEALTRSGIEGLQAEPWEMVSRVTEPKTTLRICRVRAVDGGFQRYLGRDAMGNEMCGMSLEVEFALGLLSPKDGGAQGAEEYGQRVLTALVLSPDTVPAGEILCGEILYDPKRDCFRQEMNLKLGVLAVAVQEEDMVLLAEIRLRALRS